jgi:hypothetical protein
LPRRSRQSIRSGLNGRRAGRASRRHFSALLPRWLIVAALALIPAPSLAIEGVWHGKYVCTQGPTGLTLTVTKTPDGSNWTARFCFCAIEENPRLPTGECELTGPAVPGEPIVKFTPWRWISQPPGWEMRPLELWLSADGRQILGRIDSPACRPEFELDREAGDSLPPTCQCRVVTSHAEPQAAR